MTPKQALDTAKQHLVELCSDEGLVKVGLEELKFKSDCDPVMWTITLGYVRTWDSPISIHGTLLATDERPAREFRKLSIRDEDGALISFLKPQIS